MSSAATDTGFHSLLTDEIGLASRPADALADHIESESALVDHLRENNDVDEFSGVGRRSASRIWEWFEDEYPDANRERMEDSEEYCTEFTADVEQADAAASDKFVFAFVCPRCGAENPLKGDPRDFKNKPYPCVNCRWVPLLVAQFLEAFAEANYPAAGRDDDGDS